ILYFLACWNGEPDNRPTIGEVVEKLRPSTDIITEKYQANNNSELSLQLSDKPEFKFSDVGSSYNSLQLIPNFDKINIKGIESTTSTSVQIINTVNEILTFCFKIANEGNAILKKQYILDYFNDHNVNSREI